MRNTLFCRYEAKQFCESIGAQMLLIESAQEQKFMTQYFSEWQRAGVTRMWQRISDISTSYPKPNENCDWTNGQSGYVQWGSDEPKCRKESNSCGYFTTSASEENWATDYCSKPEAFSCQVRAGSMIHAIPKPINDHHCPERTDGILGSDWVLNPNTTSCYLIGKKNVDNDNALWIQFEQAQVGFLLNNLTSDRFTYLHSQFENYQRNTVEIISQNWSRF